MCFLWGTNWSAYTVYQNKFTRSLSKTVHNTYYSALITFFPWTPRQVSTAGAVGNFSKLTGSRDRLYPPLKFSHSFHALGSCKLRLLASWISPCNMVQSFVIPRFLFVKEIILFSLKSYLRLPSPGRLVLVSCIMRPVYNCLATVLV
jgi:hypothetical protein